MTSRSASAGSSCSTTYHSTPAASPAATISAIGRTPSPGTAVYVFDAATGALEWQSGILPGGYGEVNLLRLGNVDADPQLEIVAGSE